MIYYVIPARKGSKGFPLKNRKLFDYTYKHFREAIVTSDDKEILKKANNILHRSKDLSTDEASIKDVLRDVIRFKNINKNDIVVMLYLTYPQRTREKVKEILDYFLENNITSLLCKKDVKLHPCLIMYEETNRDVINHNLYRRQDYPKVFERSHYVVIFKVSEFEKLNDALYNDSTFYYDITNIESIDVDYEKDLENIDNGK